MSMDSMNDLLVESIKDLYNAENQLVKALPRLVKKASSPALKEALSAHLGETEAHVERLEKIAELLDIKPGGKTCKAMKGLIEEGKEVLEEDGDDAVIDEAIIGAAQKVEHYEISGYGTARSIAESLGLKEVAKILDKTLQEEGAADKKLTEIAEGEVLAAVGGSSEEETE